MAHSAEMGIEVITEDIPRVVCLGSGGHAAVVVDLLQALSDKVQTVGLITSSGEAGEVLGVPVIGADADLPALVAQRRASHFIVGVGSMRGGGLLRQEMYENAIATGLLPISAVHPSAVIAPSASLDRGTVVLAGSVIQARCRIGSNVIINTRASIDHDCEIGDHAHVAPGVTCSGGVSIGRLAHVGTGAVVIQSISIGLGATVGAGAVVIKDCADHEVIMGVPARSAIRKSTGPKIA